MPIRKIAEPDGSPHLWTRKSQRPCTHHDHDPPNMIVLEAGTYEHECPACGKKQVFHVHRATWSPQGGDNPMHALGHGRGD